MENNTTEKLCDVYYCECCKHTCSRKFNYDRHLLSLKHIKMSKTHGLLSNINEQLSNNDKKSSILPENKIEEPKCIPNDVGKLIETRYCCDYCKFSTTVKKEANKHRTSKQHIINENKEEDFLEITNQYICLKCDKSYDKYKSCWEHSKRCKVKCLTNKVTVYEQVDQNPTKTVENVGYEIVETSSNTDNNNMFDKSVGVLETIVDKILENKNTEIMEKMMERMVTVMEKMTETMTNIQPSLTQNNNYTNAKISNSLNNHYSINMFLNEKCKDAVNITDWAKQLNVDYDHLYYTGENGFQKGLTNMLVENLNLCDVYNRPIHFTDVKRDSMYIRDADEWTKHENNEKLIEVLEISARQACIRLTDWMKEHEDVPEYQDLDSELGKQYLALMMSVIRPEAVRQKAYPKVMKELAKTAKLRKEDQI